MNARSLLTLAPALALGAACRAPSAPPAPIAAPAVIDTPPPAPAETSPRPDATPAAVEAPLSFGTIASTGGLLGAWEASAGYCQVHVIAAGGRTSSGVTFTRQLGEFDHSLTVVVRSKGAKGSSGVVVEVLKPSRQVVIKAEKCTRFEVQVPGGAGGTGADVEIDCDAGEGGRVRASLHAASCN